MAEIAPVKRSSYHRKLRDYLLLLEFTKLKEQAPPGVYVSMSKSNLRVWHGVIFLHAGHYKNGIFKFTISIPLEYPELPPLIRFTTPLYHPCVRASTGELDLSVQFPEWSSVSHFLLLIVVFIKRIFYLPNLWTQAVKPYNTEALRLFRTDPHSYLLQCDQCCLDSIAARYDEPITSSSISASTNTEEDEEEDAPLLRLTRPLLEHQILAEKIIAMGNGPKPANFSYLSWFVDGVDNVTNCPRLTANLSNSLELSLSGGALSGSSTSSASVSITTSSRSNDVINNIANNVELELDSLP